MRPWIRWTTGITGLVITGIGLVSTGNVLSPRFTEVGPALDGWMFVGPALVTFGMLLVLTSGYGGKGPESLEGRGPRLLVHLGLAFLALPALTRAWDGASGSAASHYAWTFSAFALGVPGLALALTGAALWMWRRARWGGP